jgi:hypothetical protein
MNLRGLILAGLVLLCATAGLALSCVPAQAAVAKYVSPFSGAATPAKSFQPFALCVDASGDVYVADSGTFKHGVVDEFSSAGTYLTQFNGEKTPGKAFEPDACAIDPSSGDVYVADPTHDVVDKFSSAGTYLSQFSGAATPGGFFEPAALAVNSSGDVYVADFEFDVVDKFSSTGTYLSQLTGEKTPAESFHPFSLALDGSGDVYVGDILNGVVDKFSSAETETYLGQFSGEASFQPESLAVDASGDVYVGDHGGKLHEEHDVVDKFSSAGTYLGQFNGAETPAKSFYPTALAFDASGDLYVGDYANLVVDKFAPASEFPLTITKAGTGGGTVECKVGAGALGACAATYPEGTKVELTATPNLSSTFAGWSVAGQPSACPGTGSCEVTMSAAESVTATFNLTLATKYPLTVTYVGTGTGTVECNTGSGAGACAAEYSEGTKVNLTETPAAGSTFAGWSEACTGTGACEVTMTAAMKVTATFNLSATPKFPLTVTKAGTGSGTVECNSGSGAGACAAEYSEGTKVNLTETPAAGSTFAGWSEACTGTGACEVTMTAAMKVTATFNLTVVTEYPLTITKAGSGSGTVQCNAGACAAKYPAGTKVTLTAKAEPGSTFAGWSVSGQPGACPGIGSCEVTINAATSVTAWFNTTPVKFPLTITKAGTGSGTVQCNTGSGAGACASEYNEGTEVTLTATAAAGSTFAGWSGACTGAGSCEVTMSAAKSVTATFTKSPPPKGKLKVPASATVSGGKALLNLSCSDAGVCAGELKLTIQIKQGRKLKTVVIGRAYCRIAAGEVQTVKIKLSGVANQLLKQFKTLDATLTGPGGLHRTVKLKLKRKLS